MPNATCVVCGCRLARDHDDERCTNCARAAVIAQVAPSPMPDEVWNSDAVRAAAESRHFGRLIRAYRNAHKPVLGQSVVAQWLGLTQGQISRIERASSPITDLDKLTRWATVLHVPQRILWFQLDGELLPEDTSPTIDDMRDVSRRGVLKTIGLSAVAVGGVIRTNVTGHVRSIGDADVEIVREMTTTFRRLDNRFGGGHSLAIATNYLATGVAPMLHAESRSIVRRNLLMATAELHQLVGWMAYDIGDAATGRKHLRQALQLCQETRNDALAAEMLAGMSHQASFARSAESAVDLGIAARQAATRTGIRALQAEAAVMEAHGHAQLGNARDCISALQAAERQFKPPDASTPHWLLYFDEAYLSAKFAHVLYDLGRPADAERFARRSLDMSDGYERGRMFNTALLAWTLAKQGAVEESLNHARTAAGLATNMRSARATVYLKQTAQCLSPYRDCAPVREFLASA